MRFPRRSGHADADSSRRAPRAWIRAVRHLPVWLRWTTLLVLVLSLAATSLWIRTNTSGSSPTGGHDAADAADAAQAVRAPGTVVSLTFDDGRASQYLYARPLLQQYGVHGTFYVRTRPLDGGGECCMNWPQVMQLYREGNEIGGSSADGEDLTVPSSPDPEQDYAAKEEEVCGAQRRLAGFGLDPRSFAYPDGKHTYDFPSHRSLAELVSSCGYLSGRVMGGLSPGASPSDSAMAIPPRDPFVVRTPEEPSSSPITLDELQQAVLAAGGTPGRWVPLIFREVCHAGDPSYTSCMSTSRPIDDTVLSAFLAWLDSAGKQGGAPSGTTVLTMRQVMGAPQQPPIPEPQTVVSLTFDDGDASQDLAGRLLQAHDMHGTFFVNTRPIDMNNPGHMSWSQVLSLHMEGNEIGGHTADHVDLTDPQTSGEAKRDQICQDHARLLQMGLDPQSFAYPYGKFDETAEELVESCGYRSARSAGSVSTDGPIVAETVPPLDPFATRALDTPDDALTLQYLQDAVVAAADHGGGWVQVVIHNVCAADDPELDLCMSGEAPIEERTFSAFLDWLQYGAPDGTTVKTVAEATDGDS
jgi:peptidoglycan/xylan/chitin deacetylase (PgdA/CDA1 family)